jgi:hypothetical protein
MNGILVTAISYKAVCHRISPLESLDSILILWNLKVRLLDRNFPLLYLILCMRNRCDSTEELSTWLEVILL